MDHITLFPQKTQRHYPMFQWLQFSGVKEFKQQIRMKYTNILYGFYSIKLI